MSENSVERSGNEVKNYKQNIPQLRFPGFDEEWEEILIKDKFDFFSTNSLSRAKLDEEKGEIKNIHYGDIHTKFPSIVNVKKEEIPFISKEIDDEKINKYEICQNGDLLIADASEDYADIGKTIELQGITDEKIVGGLHTLLLRDKTTKVFPFFNGYLFQNEKLKKQIKIKANGISVLGISKKELQKITIKIPSKEEQNKISDLLFYIDQKISSMEKKYEKNVMIKKFYLNHFFNLSDEKYEKIKLKDVLSLQGGYNFKSNKFNEMGNQKVIKIADIPNNLNLENFNGNHTDKICDNKYKVQNNDFIIALSGATFGKSGKISGDGFAFINQRIAKFNCNKCDSNFIFQLINSKQFLSYLNKIPTSSAQPNISNKDILNYSCMLPDVKKQEKIGVLLSNLDEKIYLINNEIKIIKNFKKSLLSKMFC